MQHFSCSASSSAAGCRVAVHKALLRVAFVCTGNRARSPLAAALFERHAGQAATHIRSYGVHTREGLGPLKTAASVAARLGIDLEQHRSCPLSTGCLVGTDLVVGFEEAHAAAAVEVGGASPERVFLLLELPELLESLSPGDTRDAIAELHRLRTSAGRRRRVAAVPDPVGEPEQVFAEVARVIDGVTGALAAAVLPGRNTVSALQPAG